LPCFASSRLAMNVLDQAERGRSAACGTRSNIASGSGKSRRASSLRALPRAAEGCGPGRPRRHRRPGAAASSNSAILAQRNTTTSIAQRGLDPSTGESLWSGSPRSPQSERILRDIRGPAATSVRSARAPRSRGGNGNSHRRAEARTLGRRRLRDPL
jgi:hypothetical protein